MLLGSQERVEFIIIWLSMMRREKKAVTLRDAGVEPPGIERTREEILGNFCRRPASSA